MSTPTPTRRSSRIHASGSTGITLNLHPTDTDHRRNIRRTTPTIGTLPRATRPVQNYHPSTISHRHIPTSSQRSSTNNTNTNTRTLKRARPRWYRPPPPEAYLIIRAHRRPTGGWGEDWSKKGDGWYVPLFLLFLPFYIDLVLTCRTFKLSIMSKSVRFLIPVELMGRVTMD
jgi:hypothetical protein